MAEDAMKVFVNLTDAGFDPKEEFAIFKDVFCGGDGNRTTCGVLGKKFSLEKIELKDAGALEYFQESSSSWAGSASAAHNVEQEKEVENSGPTELACSGVPSEPVPFLVVETLGLGVLSSRYVFGRQGVVEVGGGMDKSFKSRVQHVGDGKVVLEGKRVTSPVSQESVACGFLAVLPPAEMPGTVACVKQNGGKSVSLDMVVAAPKKFSYREMPIRLETYAHRLLVDAGWKVEPRRRAGRSRLAYTFVNPSGAALTALCATWKACGERLLATALDSERDENGREWSDIDSFWSELTDVMAYIDRESQYEESSLALLHRWQLLDPFMAVVWIDKRISALREGKTLKAVKSETFILNDSKKVSLTTRGVDRVNNIVTEFSPCSVGSLKQITLPAPQNFEVIEGSRNQQMSAIRACHNSKSRHRHARVSRASSFYKELHKNTLKSMARRIGMGVHSVKCSHGVSPRGITRQHQTPNRSPGTAAVQRLPISYSEEIAFPQKQLCKRGGLVRENAVDDSVRVVSRVDRNDSSVYQVSSTGEGIILSEHNKTEGPSGCPVIVEKKSLHALEEAMSFSVDDNQGQDLLACENTSNAVRRVSMQSEMQSSADQPNLHQENSTITEKLVGAEASKSKLKRTSAVSGSTKKARKKSKKISEIEATEASSMGTETDLHDDSCTVSMDEETYDQLHLPPCLGVTNGLILESSSECYERSEHFDTIRTDEMHACAAIEVYKKSAQSDSKAARQYGKKKDDDFVLLEDGAGWTLSQEDAARHESRESECNGIFFGTNNSSYVSSKKQKLASKCKKAQVIDPEASVVAADNGNISLESHSENSGAEVFMPRSGSSSEPQTKQNSIKVNKAEVKSGRKKPQGRIHDNDLLISAIIKKKNFGSSGKKNASKIRACQSKALEKLKSHKGSCRLLPRALLKGGAHSREGKRFTLGARTVLCWLIETGAISMKDIIQCRNPKTNEVVKDGWVTREGILCNCCTQILSVSDFKTHAGFKQQKSSLNLFLESGKPYTLCQFQAWSAEYKARKSHMRAMDVEDVDQNDDTCAICGDCGELICCDSCPSTYHQACLSSLELPEGSWYCPNCICVACGISVNGKEASRSLAVFECSQCEHKYHETCIKVPDHDPCMKEKVTSNAEGRSCTWFCGENCQEVYLGLRSRVGVVNCIDDGFSWTVLRCSHDDQKVRSAQKIALTAECNTKLAIALSLMEECFLPMVDPRTGIDMIPHVLYNWGSRFVRLNYKGFYAVALEKGDELISVASIRLHGVAVAEMPLIATCSKYRRQGMCRRLLNAIEKMLISFKVKMLVLSAIPSLVETWTSGFGFKPIEDEEKYRLTNVNLMLFPGTTLLKKNLHEVSSSESGGRIYPCSREDQSQACQDLVEGTNIEVVQQSADNPRCDLVTESLLLASSNVTVQQVNSEQRVLSSSFGENSILTTGPKEHCNMSDDEAYVRIGASNVYAMDSTRQAVATQMPVASIASVLDSCSASLPSTERNEGLPTDPRADKSHAVVARDVKGSTFLNVNILTEDSVSAAMNNQKNLSFQCDEVQQKHLTDASKGNDDISASDGQAVEGLHWPVISNKLPSCPSPSKLHDETAKDMEKNASDELGNM